MAGNPSKPKRPFWMHQLAEYLLGGVLVAQGLQSPTPAMPALAGGLIMLNAAVVRGPLAAFRLVGRATHRAFDLAVIGIVALLAVQPWVPVEASVRVVMVAIAAVVWFVWHESNFTEKTASRPAVGTEGGRSSEIGRLAGRAVGDTINTAKRLKKP